ncbi:hypothetical protein KSP40_PGU000359 [Platanthera guangdongensis]|uniref:KIB1-4 beta-propeller domain-containing protein n=1 Tax=Platanthera guangdongensis TaxID=2320717 RepID=A0ABR2LUD4_9ASPA
METSRAKRDNSIWCDLPSPLLMCILMRLDDAADFKAFSSTCCSWHSAASCYLGDFLSKMSPDFIVLFNLRSHETRIMNIDDNGGIFKAPPLHFYGCNDLRFIGQSNGFLIAVDIEIGKFPTVINLNTRSRYNFPSIDCCEPKFKSLGSFEISFAIMTKPVILDDCFLVLFDSRKGMMMSNRPGASTWTTNEKLSCCWDAIGFNESLFVDDSDQLIELDPRTLDIIDVLGSDHGFLMESGEDKLLQLVRRHGDRFAGDSFMAIMSEVTVDTDTEEEDIDVSGALSWPIDKNIYFKWQRSDRHCHASPPLTMTFGAIRGGINFEQGAMTHGSFWKDFSFVSNTIAIIADPDAQSAIVAGFDRVRPLPPWFSLMPDYRDSDSD